MSEKVGQRRVKWVGTIQKWDLGVKKKRSTSGVDKVNTSTGSLRVNHSAFTSFSFFLYCSPSFSMRVIPPSVDFFVFAYPLKARGQRDL